jgi:hypothetical protein
MISDPIVDEIHKTRERLLEECGGDIGVYLSRLKDRESEAARQKVSPSPGGREGMGEGARG